jgi:class 3 adenylate cyclase
MRFREGSFGQKALFAAMVGMYAFGLGLALQDTLARVGRPDIGWRMDGLAVTPTRRDAAAAGLGGSGLAVEINGVAVTGRTLLDIGPHMHTALGATNTLKLRRPGGVVADVTIPVRRLQWDDVLFSDGTAFGLGALFVVISVTSFLLRPYTASSWALLALCCIAGGLLTSQTLMIRPCDVVALIYFRFMVGAMAVAPLHAALAFPVEHPLLVRHPLILLPIYALGLCITTLQLAGWYTDWAGALRYAGGSLDTSMLLVAMLCFVARFAWLAQRARDPLVAQRARIVLIGAITGVVPIVSENFVERTFGVLIIDPQVAYAMVSLFLLALGYVTVRHDLLNARIAVRRAVIYFAVAAVLTSVATLLMAVRSYAVGLLLLPLLYGWSRFDTRLSGWLYPQRARFPELLRALGAEFATSGTIEDILDALAQAPRRLCDASDAAAFLFAGVSGRDERLSANARATAGGQPLRDEPLVQLMRTTRKEIFRDQIAVEPRFANIREACRALFDRLRAELLLPIVRDTQVIGGLAVGARASGDVYEAPEIEALLTAAQQAVQAIIRVEATERLRVREVEFAELKRFFPPQIIDQLMAKGGAAELRSQRKLVTVLFGDLRGFTSFSDSVEPEEVMATLAEYHNAVGQRIAEFSGTLERFAGDGFMVFFNDPVDQPDHVERAARMALAMHGDMQRLRQAWDEKGYRIDMGMGIHTGYATCGFIGYEGRRDYGVIGNVTNLAARLSDAAGGGEILITARVRAELSGGFRTEAVGELALKGFHQPQIAYRLVPAT